MSDTDVTVQIGADASGVQAGAQVASAAVAELGGQVSEIAELIRAQTAAMTEGFAELATVTRESMEEVVEAEEKAEAGMLGLLASVREGAESIAEMREAVMGFGEAMLAAFAFNELREFVESLGEAGERIQHTAQAFGMTTGEVQRLQTVFTAAGAGPEALQSSMLRLDRAASQAVSGQKRAADAFKVLGVNLNAPMSSAQRLEETLQGFANIPGPDKVAVAMAVFGRNIQAVAPLLGMTKDQLEEYNAQADKFGTVNEEAVGRMAALGATLNENKNALAGLQNVLGDALSPAFVSIVEDIDDMIASFTRSYSTMGVARQAMDLIASTIEALGVIIKQIGAAFTSVWDALTGQSAVAGQALEMLREIVVDFGVGVAAVAIVVEVAFDTIGGLINVLEGDFRTLGDVTRDALTLNWGKIAGDYQAGLNRVHGIVQDAIARVKGDVAAGAKDIDGLVNPDPKSEPSPKSAVGVVHGLGGEKAPKKPKDDLLSEWQEQLKQIDDAQQNWYADQNALAAKFWAGIVASGAGSAKDQQQAQDNLAEALKALDSETVTSAVEAAQKKASAAKGDVAQVQAIYAELEQTLIAHHAEGGAEWAKVEDAKVEAVRKAVAEMAAEETKALARTGAAQVKDDGARGKTTDQGLQTQQAQVKSNATVGLIDPKQEATQLTAIDAQIAANDHATQDKILADQLATLNAEITANAGNADKIKELTQQIEDAKRASADRQAEISQQLADKEAQAQIAAAQRVEQTWRTRIDGVTQSFGSAMIGMARGTTTFEGAVTSVATSIENAFASAVEKMVSNWIMQMVFGQTASQTSQAIQALAAINDNAAVAAAGAFASTVSIPIVGPALAPGAAAAAEASVLSFAGQVGASAAGGYDIPAGVNPITQLHAQEMVLPASIANPLRGMIAGQAGGGGASSGSAGGGDTYNMAISALDSRSVRRMMTGGNVRAAAGAFARHG